MLRPRIIPCLLLSEGGLVKTVNFAKPRYIGDPINAVRIFNEKSADEIMVLDIDATAKGIGPNLKLIASIADECRMPLCYGGGITTLDQVQTIIGLGVEKIAISAQAIKDPKFISQAAEIVGSQSVVVVLDVRKHRVREKTEYVVYINNGKNRLDLPFAEYLELFAKEGAGELVLNSIDCDGAMAGFDTELARLARKIVSVPITILGGAGSLRDIESLFLKCEVSGASAGSLFVYKGSFKAVLINYPNAEQRDLIAKAVRQSKCTDPRVLRSGD